MYVHKINEAKHALMVVAHGPHLSRHLPARLQSFEL